MTGMAVAVYMSDGIQEQELNAYPIRHGLNYTKEYAGYEPSPRDTIARVRRRGYPEMKKAG